MIMNYVLSFCKITAASRIFQRNFYLPLLKPITPKDALRTFKITGKLLLGSKIQHYIPVLLNHRKKRAENCKNYGQIPHDVDDSYSYMIPIIDPDDENHKLLLEILDQQVASSDAFFVYTVEDKMHNIILPGCYELAIREGEIIDVLVSQTTDKVLIKLKNFRKIPVCLEVYDDKNELYKGEGATSEAEEQFHHHGKMIMSLAKIFEAKELAEEWELEMIKIVSRKKKQKGEGSKEWEEMVSESIQNMDWDQFEIEAKKVIDQIWEPAKEERIPMQVVDLNKTRDVGELFLENLELFDQLPTLSEIPDVVKNMSNAAYEEVDFSNNRKLAGVKLMLSSGKECFITGQMVKTDEEDIFVPGQTIENDFGLSFAPGFTVNLNNTPTLIKGLIMSDNGNENPMFVPTESSITPEGDLTFCRNKEERSKATPQKIRVKQKKDKKKKKLKGDINTIVDFHEEETTDIDDLINKYCQAAVTVQESYLFLPQVMVNEIIGDDSTGSGSEDNNSDIYKVDDGLDKLIENLEDKALELQDKLEALRNLKVTLDNSVTYIQFSDAFEHASKIITNEDFDVNKLADILLTITRRVNTFRDRHCVNIQNINNPSMITSETFVTEADEKYNKSSNKLKTSLKSALFALNEIFKRRPRDQLLGLKTLSDIYKSILADTTVLQELLNLMNTTLDRNEICTSILKELTREITENKLEVLKSALILNKKHASNDVLVEKITSILKDGEVVCEAFKKLAKNNETLTRRVLEQTELKLDGVRTEIGAKEVLIRSVAIASKEFAWDCLMEFSACGSETDIEEFLQEARALANTLSLHIEDNLTCLINNNKNCSDFLQRFMLIKKLCEKDYSMKTSLARIKKHPSCGRTDPRIRRLLLESACLTSKGREIKNSLEIPLRLFQEQNFVAIEDCVWSNCEITRPVLISRKGIQAVIPKESAKEVLAGRVPYLLVDESGVTNFKPMHMFTALKMDKHNKNSVRESPTRKLSLSLSRMTA